MHLNGQPVEGWRKSAILFIILMWAVVLGLFGVLGLSIRGSGSLYRNTVLFEGSCDKAKQRTSMLRLVINVVSTTVLLSSSFFLQLAVSPTRRDIDKAHARARYLDVGVASLSNLRSLPGTRAVLWLLLASTSLPLHMFSNSCVYDADSTTDFPRVLASEGWLQNTPYYLPGIGLAASPESDTDGNNAIKRRELTCISQNAARWEALDGSACYAAYTRGNGLRARRHLVVLVTNSAAQGLWNATDVWFFGSSGATLSSLWAQRQCSGLIRHGVEDGNDKCSVDDSVIPKSSQDLLAFDRSVGPPGPGANWTIRWGGVDTFVIRTTYQRLQGRYCLSEPWVESCKSQANNVLLLIVCCFTLVKAVLCVIVVSLL